MLVSQIAKQGRKLRNHRTGAAIASGTGERPLMISPAGCGDVTHRLALGVAKR
jgi:hypothetical protein